MGPGAHAFDGATRRWNAARLDGYLGALAPAAGADGAVGDRPGPVLPPGGSEPVGEAAAAAEAVILGLRLDEGLPLAAAGAGPLGEHLDWALDSGLLEPFEGPGGRRVRLTIEGRLLSNELFSRLV